MIQASCTENRQHNYFSLSAEISRLTYFKKGLPLFDGGEKTGKS